MFLIYNDSQSIYFTASLLYKKKYYITNQLVKKEQNAIELQGHETD